MIEPEAPTAIDVVGSFPKLLPTIAVYIAVCAFGAWIFRREAPRIAEDL